jgi:hypothetical protein
MESKSILRAAAGQVVRERDDADYFPSYELISSPTVRGSFFEPNQRSVTPHGVAFVMSKFFEAVGRNGEACGEGKPAAVPAPNTIADGEPRDGSSATDVVCEEELLQAFEGGA